MLAARAGAFFGVVMDHEKITERIDLHLPLTMKRDLQDASMLADRKMSDFIRHILACWLYGNQHNCRAAECKSANGCDGGLE